MKCSLMFLFLQETYFDMPEDQKFLAGKKTCPWVFCKLFTKFQNGKTTNFVSKGITNPSPFSFFTSTDDYLNFVSMKVSMDMKRTVGFSMLVYVYPPGF